MSELLEDEEISPQISSLTAIPSTGGRYEVTVNEELIYSKLAIKRHAEPGEIYHLVRAFLNGNR